MGDTPASAMRPVGVGSDASEAVSGAKEPKWCGACGRVQALMRANARWTLLPRYTVRAGPERKREKEREERTPDGNVDGIKRWTPWKGYTHHPTHRPIQTQARTEKDNREELHPDAHRCDHGRHDRDRARDGNETSIPCRDTRTDRERCQRMRTMPMMMPPNRTSRETMR